MVTPTYYPVKGGMEEIVRNLSIKLNQKGIHTDVMTFNIDRKWNPKWKGKVETNDGSNVFKIPALNWFPITHSNRVTMGVNLIPGRFANRLKNYDIIHFHYGDLSFPLFSYFVKKPKVLHLHGLAVNFCKRYFISRFILKHTADLYICLTKLMEKELAQLGIPKDSIRCLPNGVDIKLFHPLGKKEDNLVLFVGRICPQKGLYTLLKSITYLEKPIHLVIIGPKGWDLKYFENILKLIEKENKKGKHKITYAGSVKKEELIKWYRKASIFVCPSLFEPFGIVNLEALSCETPVIASNVGGIPDVVHKGMNGILIPPNDAVKLAEAIQYLLDNEDIRKKLGKEGRIWIEKNFSNEVIIKKLFQIYKELIQ